MAETAEVKVVMGFQLPCRICGESFLVGPTHDFQEAKTGLRTGYYSVEPDEDGSRHLVGVSEGTGDSFECMPCHAMEWVSIAVKKIIGRSLREGGH